MKKLIVIFVLVFLAKVNAQNFPVIVDSVAFYADSVSTLIELNKNEFIADLYVPSSRADTITLKVLLPDDTREWYMSESGADYVLTVDSTKNTVVTFPPTKVHAKRKMYLIVPWSPTDTFYIPYTKRPF